MIWTCDRCGREYIDGGRPPACPWCEIRTLRATLSEIHALLENGYTDATDMMNDLRAVLGLEVKR